ncbi:MAG: hypothetical protein AAF628_31350, partial [Planctomycetota bacterium]
MTVARSAAEVLGEHVTLAVESIDRLYLNLYVPILQAEAGVAHFWRHHRGYDFASSALMAPMTNDFVSRVERFARDEHVDLFTFRKGQRKEDLAKEYLAKFPLDEGVLFIGKAQEKTKVVRTERRRNPKTGSTYAWLVSSTAMVNHYYVYGLDRDFGPFFIKFGSYFPYNGKVCLNGHEYAKRQLAKRGIAYEELDNGFLSCTDPRQLQRICDGLSDQKIRGFIRKWFKRLPHPFPPKDRRAGYDYEISMLQAEFALTQVFDRPLSGRVFFEQILRENLDIGRPEQVQLIFDRRVTRRTPGRFRTRVVTDGVIPSLLVDYKHSKIKQYFKEARALRTETVVNDTYDFAIGRKLQNLSELRKVGFAANRRLLDVQRISYDCWIGEDNFHRITRPVIVGEQRTPALRFGDPRVTALMSALLVFRLLPRGFTNRDLRQHVAPFLGLAAEQMTPGMMTYDLRRLRLHGLIERVPKSRRYNLTKFGSRAAVFLTRVYARLLRPGSTLLEPSQSLNQSTL